MSARRRAELITALERTTNPVLRAFRYSWDHSLTGLARFRDNLDGWDEPTSIRDEADDFLEDLDAAMRADS